MSYDDAISEGRDLVAAARERELPPVEFRDGEVGRVLEAFDRSRSALIVGPPGVGKTAVAYGVAHEMAKRDERGLVQLSTADVMCGTKYIGEWNSFIKPRTRPIVRSIKSMSGRCPMNPWTQSSPTRARASRWRWTRPRAARW